MFAVSLPTPPNWLVKWLLWKADDPGNFKISPIYGPDGSLYMERKPLTRFRWLRLHITYRSDIDIHLHDHPWWNISWVIRNGYIERVPDSQDQHPTFDQAGMAHDELRKPGAVVFRRATDRHRLLLKLDTTAMAEMASVSVFVTGPWRRKWGFYTESGWVYWKDYLHERPEATAG